MIQRVSALQWAGQYGCGRDGNAGQGKFSAVIETEFLKTTWFGQMFVVCLQGQNSCDLILWFCVCWSRQILSSLCK